MRRTERPRKGLREKTAFELSLKGGYYLDIQRGKVRHDGERNSEKGTEWYVNYKKRIALVD